MYPAEWLRTSKAAEQAGLKARAEREWAEQRTRKKRSETLTGGDVILIALGFAAILGIGTAIVYATGHGGGDGPSKDGAINACEHFVRGELKSPSTADFPYYDQDNVFQANKRYVISGYVDAENSFSAKLRLNYTCTVQWHPKKKAWGLVELSGLH
jgi:hypothetical protein